MALLRNRMVRREDAFALLNYFKRNKDFFEPWEPKRSDQFNEASFWFEQLALRELQQLEKTASYWVAENPYDGHIVAHCSLTNVIRGPFQAAYMGYGIDEKYQGKGLMKALCVDVIGYAFNELKLNRIMANHMPANKRSENLLKSLGFVKEGYAERYLKINGKWEDHVLTALINPSSEEPSFAK